MSWIRPVLNSAPLLSLCVVLLAGCQPGGPSDGGGAPGEAGDDGPVRVDLSAAAEEVQATLEQMIGDAVAASDDGAARGRLGMTYEANGFFSAAHRSYLQAMALSPENPRWAYFAAQQAARDGELGEALGLLDRSASVAPGYAPLSLRRGAWLIDLGRHAEAETVYRQVLSRNPRETAASLGLARALMNGGRPGEAVPILDDLLARVQHPYVRQLLARAHRENGEPQRAAEILAERGGTVAPPGWRDPWNEEKGAFRAGYSAGLIEAEKMFARNDVAGALERLEELRRERPDDVTTLNNLSVTYLRTGRTDEAQQVLEDAVRRQPDYFPFHLNLAALYQRQRDLNRALGHLDRAIELNPTLSHAHQQRADLLMAAGRVEEARSSFAEAMLYDAGNPVLFVRAAILEHRTERFDESRRLSQLALSIDPRNSGALLLLATAEGELGNHDAADAALTRAKNAGATERDLNEVRARLAGLRGRG